MLGLPVRSVLEPRKLVVAAPETSVAEAAGLMKKGNVGAVLIVEQGRLIGIFTGMVPRSYILHHHSLTIEGAAHAFPGALATSNGVIMKAEIVLLVLTLVGGGFGIEAIGELPKPDLKRGFESIVSPVT